MTTFCQTLVLITFNSLSLYQIYNKVLVTWCNRGHGHGQLRMCFYFMSFKFVREPSTNLTSRLLPTSGLSYKPSLGYLESTLVYVKKKCLKIMQLIKNVTSEIKIFCSEP